MLLYLHVVVKKGNMTLPPQNS